MGAHAPRAGADGRERRTWIERPTWIMREVGADREAGRGGVLILESSKTLISQPPAGCG